MPAPETRELVGEAYNGRVTVNIAEVRLVPTQLRAVTTKLYEPAVKGKLL